MAETPKSRIARLCAATDEPVLSDIDLDELLYQAQRIDAAGRMPTIAGWVPTYDFDAAAAEGWRWKAGKAAGRFNFAEDGQRFDRAQIYAHCVSQASAYASRIAMSVRTGVGDAH